MWYRILASCRGHLRRGRLSAGIVATIAFGLAVNTAVFDVLDELFVRFPSGVRDPRHVVRVVVEQLGVDDRDHDRPFFSMPEARAIERSGAVPTTAAYLPPARTLLEGGRNPQAIRVAGVSGAFFELLGVQPERGRLFGRESDTSTAAPFPAVVSHEFLQRAFSGDAATLGHVLRVFGRDVAIVGVLPPRFAGAEIEVPDIWLPLGMAGTPSFGSGWEKTRGIYPAKVLVRLPAGTDITSVAARLTRELRDASRMATSMDSYPGVALRPITSGRVALRGGRRLPVLLAAASLLVTVIACLNVSNLLLLLGLQRRPEFATRLALGEPPAMLCVQILIDVAVLVVVAGGVGILLSLWFTLLVRPLFIPTPPAHPWLVNGRTTSIMLGSMAITSLLAVAVPASQLFKLDLMDMLKATSGSSIIGGRHRLRDACAALQIALSVVLVAGAALFFQSLLAVQRLDLGFTARNVVLAVAPPAVPGAPMAGPEAYRRAADALRRLPGVTSVGVTTAVPFRSETVTDVVVRGGAPQGAEQSAYLAQVTPEYFESLGIAPRLGRLLSAGDTAGSRPVALVNETFVQTALGGAAALNRCVIVPVGGDRCRWIVGVVPDTYRTSIDEPPGAQIYLPLSQSPLVGPAALAVLTDGSSTTEPGALRAEVLRAAPGAPTTLVVRLQDLIDRQTAPWRAGFTVLAVFGSVTLLLALTGFYAVIAYVAHQQRREFALRMVLGASPQHLVNLMLRRAGVVCGSGLVLGIAGAGLAAERLRELLFHPADSNVALLAVVGLGALVGAAAAILHPVASVARTAPVVALRE
jgi:putative ABC transport system permease protein